MRVRGKVRRMGNSLGLVIPREEVERNRIVEGDVIELEVEKKVNIKELFGSLKFRKDTQQLKDEAREGWLE